MQQAVSSYIKLIPFSNFNLWDVKRYYDNTQLEFENVVSLSDILIPYRKPVSKQEMIKNKWRIISKINFSGELFLREFDEINSYKGNLNIVPDDAIIYSKINVRHGCIYYHAQGKTPFGVSSEYPTYKFDSSKVDGRFLHKLLRSDAFKKLLNTKTTGISKARVKQNEFLDTKIPLPSIDEQRKIIEAFNAKVREIKNLRENAKKLESDIEEYFFEALHIKASKKRSVSTALKVVQFDSIDKWGVEYNLGSNSNELLKSAKFPNQKLSEVVFINPITRLPKEDKNISFIPMECVSDDYGEVVELRQKKVSESKGYTKFQEGDLIWARITPCMQNGKSAIVRNLQNGLGCGSTEFHVIRKDSEKVNLDYVYHILRLDPVLTNAMSHFTGSAGQRRVPKSFLEDLLIPIPPASIQQSIANKLAEMKEKIKSLNQRAIVVTQEAEKEFEKQIFG